MRAEEDEEVANMTAQVVATKLGFTPPMVQKLGLFNPIENPLYRCWRRLVPGCAVSFFLSSEMFKEFIEPQSPPDREKRLALDTWAANPRRRKAHADLLNGTTTATLSTRQ
jgi:hypothetical protein